MEAPWCSFLMSLFGTPVWEVSELSPAATSPVPRSRLCHSPAWPVIIPAHNSMNSWGQQRAGRRNCFCFLYSVVKEWDFLIDFSDFRSVKGCLSLYETGEIWALTPVLWSAGLGQKPALQCSAEVENWIMKQSSKLHGMWAVQGQTCPVRLQSGGPGSARGAWAGGTLK